MKPNWNTLTVGQYQELYRLSISTNLDDFEKVEKAICILYNLSESEVDELLMPQFTEYANACKFLFTEEIPGKAKKTLRCGLKKYAINYKVSKLNYGQYISIQSFAEKPIENMHYILACIVNPVKFGFKRKNIAGKHPEYSQDLTNAKMIDVYHSCVFFCKVYASSIKAIRGYLETQMIAKGTTREEAQRLLNHSISAMDGFIQQKSLLNL